jgi:hypothetical protein
MDKITDVIAADSWGYRKAGGKSTVSRIEIGRPRPVPSDPNGDWYCPVFVEHFTARIVPAYGVGAVDALMNAITLVRSFANEIGDFTPRAEDFPNRTRQD